MNTIYLMKDEKKDFALLKVGFATDLNKRIYVYTTHNPLIECISHVDTRESSKHKIEGMFHDEISRRGYSFVSAKIDGKRTEWFKIDYDDPFYKEVCEKGLNAFSCGKNRKNHGYFVTDAKKSIDRIANW